MTTSQFHSRIGRGLTLMLAVALLIAIAPSCIAQEVTAAITGTVTDPSGAAVANAAVTAKDASRGTVWTTTTNTDGVYNLPRLPVGSYQVRVEEKGFQTAVQPQITLELNQTARLDFKLTIGELTQTVEVSSAAPLLQTDTTQVGTVMQSHAIESLPLETRNYNQLALLMPGALTTSPAAFNTGQQTFNAGRPYINGNREQANYYLLDGMDNNEFVDNNVAYSPNVDAIQEFNVISNNPSAEFGQFLGGAISVSLKSGSNGFHGDVFEFLRNDFFNANEWSRNFSPDPSVNSAPTKLRWNQFGGTLGGPIKKNKLFFFGDYQGSRFDTPASAQPITTFTQQELTGNFSDIATQLHYPGTTVPIPGNNLANAAICGAGQTFGSSPCINGLSKTALGILNSSLFPKATSSGVLNNAVNVQHTYTNGDQGDFKVDWAATDKDYVVVRYTQAHIENPTVNSQPLLYNSTGNNVFPMWNGVINYTRTISPTFVNEVRAGVNYYPAEGNVQSPTSVNAGSLVPGEPTKFLPGLAFIGSNVGGAQNGPFPVGTVSEPEIFHQSTIQFEDTAVLTHGTHTMHMGFQVLRYRNNFFFPSTDGESGQINFNGQYTGDAGADFLLGLPSYMAIGSNPGGTVGQRNSSFGAFFQDDWRINSHLTVNLGLRWQLFTPIYEVHDRQTNFGELTGQVELAGQNGNSRALYNQYNGIANFLPRLGVAWSPWGNDTVIRAAFGRTSFWEGTGENNRATQNAPWSVDQVAAFNAGTNGAIPSNQVTLDQGFTGLSSVGGVPCNVSTVLSTPRSCFFNTRIHLTDPNLRPSVSNQWNLSIQHQFGNSTTVQAAYVGQHSDHLKDILFANQRVLNPDGTISNSLYLAGNPTLQSYVNALAVNTLGSAGQARLNESTGIQNYNALQLSVQRRLSSGLALQGNYTWSKCLTNAPGYYARFGDSTQSQASADKNFQEYVYNLGLDYGYCDHDVTSVFNGYVTYDLPFGHNRMFGKNANKAVDALLGDWELQTIFTVHGGFPITIYDFSDPSGTGSAEPRADCVAPSIQTPYKNFAGGGYIWFDPTTMAHPQPGHLGNCGVGTERGPGLKQVDLSLSKQFRITEHQNVEFRAQAINAFNTPIFWVQGFAVDVFGGSNIGVVNNSLGARNLQFALKFNF